MVLVAVVASVVGDVELVAGEVRSFGLEERIWHLSFGRLVVRVSESEMLLVVDLVRGRWSAGEKQYAWCRSRRCREYPHEMAMA